MKQTIVDLFNYLFMRKTKNKDGYMEPDVISISKVCAVLIAVLQGIETVSPYFDHPVVIPKEVYVWLASLGGIALKEGIDRSAPPLK